MRGDRCKEHGAALLPGSPQRPFQRAACVPQEPGHQKRTFSDAPPRVAEMGLPSHTPGTCSPHPTGPGKTTHSSPGGVGSLCHRLPPHPDLPSTSLATPPNLSTSLLFSPKAPAAHLGEPASLTQDVDSRLQVLLSIASPPGPPCPCQSHFHPLARGDSAGLAHSTPASHSHG